MGLIFNTGPQHFTFFFLPTVLSNTSSIPVIPNQVTTISVRTTSFVGKGKCFCILPFLPNSCSMHTSYRSTFLQYVDELSCHVQINLQSLVYYPSCSNAAHKQIDLDTACTMQILYIITCGCTTGGRTQQFKQCLIWG